MSAPDDSGDNYTRRARRRAFLLTFVALFLVLSIAFAPRLCSRVDEVPLELNLPRTDSEIQLEVWHPTTSAWVQLTRSDAQMLVVLLGDYTVSRQQRPLFVEAANYGSPYFYTRWMIGANYRVLGVSIDGRVGFVFDYAGTTLVSTHGGATVTFRDPSAVAALLRRLLGLDSVPSK